MKNYETMHQTKTNFKGPRLPNIQTKSKKIESFETDNEAT